MRVWLLAAGLVGGCAFAQTAGPALSIDAGANQHAISPDIYGINFYWTLPSATDPGYAAAAAAAASIRATARRWGGNQGSTYNWQLDVANLDSDWYFEVLPGQLADPSALPAGSTFNQFADNVRITAGKMFVTAPVLGWLPKARQEMAAFNVAKYGPQCSVDPYSEYHPGFSAGAGNGVVYSATCSSNPVYIVNDPNDTYAPYDQTFQSSWASYLLTRYGKGGQGGAAVWELDNEPIWWNSTHRDIHPNPSSYDEILNTDTTYAAAIKQADPTALISAPVNDNWASLWFSMKDIQAGWSSPSGAYYANPVDQKAHGGTPLLAWYLQQFNQYQQTNGQRLLDYVDMHAYIAPAEVGDSIGSPPESASVQALRLESTREFWDPTYVVSGDYWIVDPTTGAPIAPYYIPRVQAIISANYPGTKLAITEYDWGRQDTLNGGLAQADLLGIFGRQGLDVATLWPQLNPTYPAAFAYKMYRNYDGIGGAFGETSVQSTSADQSQLAVYGAVRSDLNLTAVVINKTGSDLTSTLNLANFQAGTAAKVWQYSGANLNAIVAQSDVAVGSGALTTVFPANSITMLAIPPANFPVAKPVITAVTNAASYATAVAPGQMVIVWGTGMGPATLNNLTLDANGLVSTSVAGTRVLFDGIPAPIVYVSGAQLAVVTPYFGTSNVTSHVQVEYQGVISDPYPVTVAATAPALFTSDASGTGQGAILNQDGITHNSVTAPAPPGSVVILWGTGEGVTDPPGVDGRLAIDVLPKPLAAVSVTIGGLPATVQYKGAAPYLIPGVFQINAVVPANVAPGNNVPVEVTIGNATTQTGVTLAVQ